uniref:Octanoyl-[acyl-carrier-protein]:protein N-octanoyltransferase LIPT2, mitochondrial n=1 Tax=Globodera pallida TaxID=36090 RepID=A0A183BM96_GLOPA
MIQAFFFGRVPYLTGLCVQESLCRQIVADPGFRDHFLCLFEHSPTYTVGIRQDQYSEEQAQRLRALGAEFHRQIEKELQNDKSLPIDRIKRGGLITFHGPGQLVAYPVFNLRKLSPDGKSNGLGVRRFVELVEEVLIQMLECDFGLKGVGRTRDPGVWVDGIRKVAAIGIQVRHGVISHGLALNCDTDLGWFDHCLAFEKHFKVPVLLEEGHRAETFLSECIGAEGRRETLF